MRFCVSSLYILIILILNPYYIQSHPSEDILVKPRSICFTLTTEDGLSSNNVTALLQDRQGFIWIGTSNGLNRYDGYTFTLFQHDFKNSNSISNNYINDLIEDHNGNIWIATNNGLDCYDTELNHFTRYNPVSDLYPDEKMTTVKCIFEDSSGTIWITGMPNTGLMKISPASGNITKISFKEDNLKIGLITDITEEQPGYLILSGINLVKYNTRTGNAFSEPYGIQYNNYWCTEKDSKGKLYISNYNMLNKIDLEQGKVIRSSIYPETELHNFILGLEGFIWAGTRNSGVIRLDPETLEIKTEILSQFDFAFGLSDNKITEIIQDKSGLIWIGTLNRGISVYNPLSSNFEYYQITTEVQTSDVNSLYGDHYGNIWLHCGDSIIVFDSVIKKIVKQINIPEYVHNWFPSENNSIYCDRNGNVWAGFGRLLLRFSNPGYELNEFLPYSEEQDPIFVASITDSDKGIWFSEFSHGIYLMPWQYEKTKNELQSSSGSLYIEYINMPRKDININKTVSSGDVTVVYTAPDGMIWAGYIDGGISQLNPYTQAFTHYDTYSGLSNMRVRSRINTIYQDNKNRLWIGSQDGLLLLDRENKNIIKPSLQEGLSINPVCSILEDKFGILWISTQLGIYKYNTDTEEVIHFNAYDGLGINNFSVQAAWKSPDGNMYFGGEKGFVKFNPENIIVNNYNAPLLITQLSLYNTSIVPGEDPILEKQIWLTKELKLANNKDIISFEFSMLAFQHSSEIRYRYMLEGFEKQWNEVNSLQHYATYTNLPPGKYLFRVQASDRQGIWENKEAKLELIIQPALWETIWFRILILLALVALVIAVFKLRMHSINRQKQLLQVKVNEQTKELREEKQHAEILRSKAESANKAKSMFLANMSHELRSPLNAVIGFSQLMLHGGGMPSQYVEYTKSIVNSGNHLLKLINEVLDLSKIEANKMKLKNEDFNLVKALYEIEEMFTLKAKEKGLELVFTIGKNVPGFIHTDQIKLRQILINLLANALKFTEKGSIHLSCKMSDNKQDKTKEFISLIFSVEDSGCGIAQNKINSLFKPFTQLKDSDLVQEGTGLGLPISEQFIKLMKGTITVESTLNKGSTFAVKIPVKKALSEKHREEKDKKKILGIAPDSLKTFGGRLKILVVDDNKENRILLVELLKTTGFIVKSAVNGKEAVDLEASWSPHFIWMDLRMPVMDGIEAKTKILEKHSINNSSVPPVIVAITASSFEKDKQNLIADGFTDVIRKPYIKNIIFYTMKKYLKIEYIYEVQERIELSFENKYLSKNEMISRLKLLNKKLLEEFRYQIVIGDMDGINKIVTRIKIIEKDLATSVENFVNKIKYDEILEMLDNILI